MPRCKLKFEISNAQSTTAHSDWFASRGGYCSSQCLGVAVQSKWRKGLNSDPFYFTASRFEPHAISPSSPTTQLSDGLLSYPVAMFSRIIRAASYGGSSGWAPLADRALAAQQCRAFSQSQARGMYSLVLPCFSPFNTDTASQPAPSSTSPRPPPRSSTPSSSRSATRSSSPPICPPTSASASTTGVTRPSSMPTR